MDFRSVRLRFKFTLLISYGTVRKWPNTRKPQSPGFKGKVRITAIPGVAFSTD